MSRAGFATAILAAGQAGMAFGQTSQPAEPKTGEELMRRLVGEWAGTGVHSGNRVFFAGEEIKRYQVLQDAHVDLLEKTVPIVEDGKTFHMMFHAKVRPLNVRYVELTDTVRTGPKEENTNVPDRLKIEFLPDQRVRMTEVDARANTEGHSIVYERQGMPGSADGEALLQRGKKLYSDSRNYFLEFQDDGNLVVRKADGTFHWGLADQLKRGQYNSVRTIRLQDDGNLVASGEDAQGKRTFIWSAIDYTPGTPTKLKLTDEGVLQLVRDTPGEDVLWSSDKPK